MDKIDEEFIVKILQMFEEAYLRSFASQTILEFHKVPHWETHVEGMVADPRVQPELREAFQRIYASFAPGRTPADRGTELLKLLKLLPTSGKIQ
ncbi:MAG: hypothetical protein WBV69_15135 [Candidatus Sulfotelmatobacter sp.]